MHLNPPGSIATISICMLTANRDHLLKPLLQELITQVSSSDEILVLDTAGSDSTSGLINELNCPQIRYNRFVQPQFNFAEARNELLKLASCDVIAFIDDDAYPFPDWLEQIRSNIQNHTSLGGATVSDGEMPGWWNTDINWCIGLSPPGTILGQPGFYPDTCNLAAQKHTWERHPFDVISAENRQLYSTGREDAEWWVDRRLDGQNVSIQFRQAVAHHVHADRLTVSYIRQRAQNDGVSSWSRRPTYEAATAIPWDLAHIAGVVFDKTVRHPFNFHDRLPDSIWLQRQWGKYKAVWKDTTNSRPRRREQIWQLSKAAKFQLKIRAGEVAFRSLNIIRHRGEFPVPAPRNIFISADCFLGDTILLRRHIKSIADSFSEAKIQVSCRYPHLMTRLAPNIISGSTAAISENINATRETIDTAIIPYFPFGDFKLWREKLSTVGVAFDCDEGFPGRRDYIYARRIIPKNMELHEHENLARLFRLWDLKPSAAPPPFAIASSDQEWATDWLAKNRIERSYILVQFGAGHESKEWPLDCWIPFFKELKDHVDIPIVITGGRNWAEAAQIAIREVNHPAGVFSSIGDTIGQMGALINQACVFLGSCSGPKHMAMALGTPTFTLYAASEPHRWGATENHEIHAYVNALPQKLSGMELQGLDGHHRIRLLDPVSVAEKFLHHYKAIKRLEQ